MPESNIATLFVNIIITSRRAHAQLNRLERQTSKTREELEKLRLTSAKIGLALVTAFAVTFIFRTLQTAIGGLINSFREYDAILKDIRKTTEITVQESQELGKVFRDIASARAGITTKGLGEAAAIGGRLGIEKDKESLEEFAIAAEQLAKATADLNTETAATSLGKFIAVTDQSTKAAFAFTSAVNELENNSNALAGEILDVATRSGASLTAIGLMPDEILAISAALKDVGLQTQIAGSFLNRFVEALAGGRGTEALVDLLGISFEQLREDVDNGKSAVDILRETLIKLGDDQQKSALFLREFGLEGVKQTRSFRSLAANIDDFDKFLRISNEAMTSGSSHLRELNIESSKLDAKIIRLSESWDRLKTSLASLVAGPLADLIDSISLLNDLLATSNERIEALDTLSSSARFGNLIGGPSPTGSTLGLLGGLALIGGAAIQRSREAQQNKLDIERGKASAEAVKQNERRLQIVRDEEAVLKRIIQAQREIRDFQTLDAFEQSVNKLKDRANDLIRAGHDLNTVLNAFQDRLDALESSRGLERMRELRDFITTSDFQRQINAISDTAQDLIEKGHDRAVVLDAKRRKLDDINFEVSQRKHEEKRRKFEESLRKDRAIEEFITPFSNLESSIVSIRNEAADLLLAGAQFPTILTGFFTQVNALIRQTQQPAAFRGITEAWKNAQLEVFREDKFNDKMLNFAQKQIDHLSDISRKIGDLKNQAPVQ